MCCQNSIKVCLLPQQPFRQCASQQHCSGVRELEVQCASMVNVVRSPPCPDVSLCSALAMARIAGQSKHAHRFLEFAGYVR